MIVTRAMWNARPPKNRAGKLTAPTGVTYHWGGPPVGIRGHFECADKIRAWQRFHMDDRGWADIAYNLIACPHGSCYEGRGAGIRSAANGTNLGNGTHYAICYLGGEGEPLTDAGKRGLLDARNYLIEHGNAGPEIRTHNSWKSTGCPGPQLEQWVHDGCPCDEPAPVPKLPEVLPTEVDMPVLMRGTAVQMYLTDEGTWKRWVKSTATVEKLRRNGHRVMEGPEFDSVLAPLPEGEAIA